VLYNYVNIEMDVPQLFQPSDEGDSPTKGIIVIIMSKISEKRVNKIIKNLSIFL
jgi:hypothetical protein